MFDLQNSKCRLYDFYHLILAEKIIALVIDNTTDKQRNKLDFDISTTLVILEFLDNELQKLKEFYNFLFD